MHILSPTHILNNYIFPTVKLTQSSRTLGALKPPRGLLNPQLPSPTSTVSVSSGCPKKVNPDEVA